MDNFFILLGIISIITICVFLVSDKLAHAADDLAMITGISGALVGFLLIAAITSVPEMVSTFIASSKGYYSLAAGGILGSNSVNIAILSVIFIIFYKQPLQIHLNSIFSFLSGLILLTVVGFLILLYSLMDVNYNIYLIVLIVLLIYSSIIYYSYKLNNMEYKQEVTTTPPKNIHLKSALVPFICCSIGIVILSWILVLFCEKLTEVPLPIYGKPLGEHFVGTLILAVATSIPEFATTYQIVKMGNTNMAVENISGSNIFNLMVLVVASLFAPNIHFWNEIPINSLYTVFSIYILSIIICILGLIKASKKINISFYIIIVLLWLYSLFLIF